MHWKIFYHVYDSIYWNDLIFPWNMAGRFSVLELYQPRLFLRIISHNFSVYGVFSSLFI